MINKTQRPVREKGTSPLKMTKLEQTLMAIRQDHKLLKSSRAKTFNEIFDAINDYKNNKVKFRLDIEGLNTKIGELAKGMKTEQAELKKLMLQWMDRFREEYQNISKENQGFSREMHRSLQEYRGLVTSYSNEKLKESFNTSITQRDAKSQEKAKRSEIQVTSRNIKSAKLGSRLHAKSFEKEYSIKKFSNLRDSFDPVILSSFIK